MWQSVVASHSSSFLQKHEKYFPAWIAASVKANSCAGLHAIVTQSHHDDPHDPLHAKTLSSKVGAKDVLVISGSQDRIASPESVRELAQCLREGGSQVQELELDSGHMVPIEQPKQWRQATLDFLSAGT